MGIDVSSLSPSNQDYVKALFNLGEWSDAPVTAKALARKVGVRLSSASDAVRRLEKMDLVDHTPYGAIALTSQGRKFALAMVRRHRLLECFLDETLNYRWDQVHAEAERLEHSVSDFMIERIDELLGHPTRDPHGDPVPTAEGDYPPREDNPQLRRLSELSAGESGTVERISDSDPELLQYFFAHGLVVGARVSVEQADPYSEAKHSRISPPATQPERDLSLGDTAARAVWVRIDSGSASGS